MKGSRPPDMYSKLNLELAREYYKLAPRSILSFYALLVIVTCFYWGKLPTAILLPWILVNFVGTSVFLFATWRFRQQDGEVDPERWLRIYTYLILIQDMPWGLIGPMSYIIDDEVYRMLTLFMLAGMTAGGIITRAILLKNYVISLFSLLIPIAATLALQQTLVADTMLALVVTYMVFMLSVAKNYSGTINRNITLWLANEQLLAEVRTSHAEVQQANQELTREIEQRKLVESELMESKERSERANETKSQFLATVSHELRTPLNGILGFADLLQGENLDPHYQRYIGQIGKAAHSLLRIVNDILDITAIEAGHISLHDEPFSLHAELGDTLTLLLPVARAKGLMLRMEFGEGLEDTLRGDASRLRQIVSNLLSNAVKYTDEGEVKLHVSRLPSTSAKVALRFDVMDTGIGMDAEALNSIFNSFTRVENFETRRHEGTGLGLAIVKTLVLKMNGKLGVDSTPGEGSCFRVELEFERSNTLPARQTPSRAIEAWPEEWGDFNVLVVDDNDINRMVLAAFLAKADIPFTEACNGREALELVHTGNFDLVLLDIQMPDISGIDVAIRLRQELISMPILIAVTAHAFPEQRQAILEAGFTDFLIKPIIKSELMATLTQVYQLRRRQCNPLGGKSITA